MKDYIEESIYTIETDVKGSKPILVGHALFKINEDSLRTTTKQLHEMFQQIIVKLLCVSQWCQLDIQLVIGFLSTQGDSTITARPTQTKMINTILMGHKGG